jgi:hypothetical protein
MFVIYKPSGTRADRPLVPWHTDGRAILGAMATRRFIKGQPEELAAHIKSLGRGLVVFDGRPGSRKTYLADDMARRIGCKSADADRDFLDHDKGTFIGALRLDEMQRSLTDSLARSPLILFSTVCARQAIELARLSAAAFIWVEQMSLMFVHEAERHFEYDDLRWPLGIDPLHDEVETYPPMMRETGSISSSM